jgi:two-component system, LytTR family, sensor kinase
MDNLILRFLIKYKVHIIAWLCFITYETVLVGLISERFAKVGSYVIHYILNIALFYFHAHFVLSRILKNRIVILAMPIGIALEIILYCIVLYIVDNTAANFYEIFGVDRVIIDHSFVLKVTWRSLYLIGFSTGYYFLMTFLKEKERTMALEKQQLTQVIHQQKMEKELTKAQNAYLRAQINPHFLFNTLNFIYNKTRKTSPVAADAILTLSAMMRYAVETNEDKGYILIEEEIEQIHNLIHLHKLRQNHQIYFEIQVQDNIRKLSIIPLVLITLVENIFKHGNLSLMSHSASIKIYTTGIFLHIETDNLINAIHNASGLSKGLENIEKRLYHTYREAASFQYTTTAHNHFKTYIKIKLELLNSTVSPLKVSEGTGR